MKYKTIKQKTKQTNKLYYMYRNIKKTVMDDEDKWMKKKERKKEHKRRIIIRKILINRWFRYLLYIIYICIWVKN